MSKVPQFSLFFFSADSSEREHNKYQMLLHAQAAVAAGR